jgi:shikimate dehydrogenase
MPNPLDDTKVYTLADLKTWEKLRPGLPPSLAVLGDPVAHSVSPQMHNAALAELAKQHAPLQNWRYCKFEVKPRELKAALETFIKNNFLGLNLTVPHKIVALDLVEIASNEAQAVGAVNTLVAKKSSAWNGFVTDPYGLGLALQNELGVNFYSPEKTAVILGAGGAARSAAVYCLDSKSSAIWIGNRSMSNLTPLLERLRPFDPQNRIRGFDVANPPAQAWAKNAVIINATTVGMKRNDPLPFDVKLLGQDAKVFDMVYNRHGPTKFVAAAQARGLRAADGLGMLVWQGAKSLSIWIKAHEGIDITPEAIAPTMMAAACAALGLPPRHA